MQLTTKGRYAVMAILEIASQMSDIPVTLAEISAKQNIPVNYLEQIFAKLKKANIVRSAKGPKGGYIINEK
jgi:Rrf2 family iron-sulfur cluster assembly transcriptional regulator